MTTSRKKYFTKIISFASIALLCLVVTNNTIYIHAHVDRSGIIYYHSHFYDKNSDTLPIKTHRHSNAEILFYLQINAQFTFISAAAAIAIIIIIKSIIRHFHINDGIICAVTIKNKAPPIL